MDKSTKETSRKFYSGGVDAWKAKTKLEVKRIEKENKIKTFSSSNNHMKKKKMIILNTKNRKPTIYGQGNVKIVLKILGTKDGIFLKG